MQENVTEDTQDHVSNQIKTLTDDKGSQMSSSDVNNTILLMSDLLKLNTSEITLDNLISTIDNVGIQTELSELREKGTSNRFRDSAAKIVAKKSKRGKAFLKSLNSVG